MRRHILDDLPDLLALSLGAAPAVERVTDQFSEFGRLPVDVSGLAPEHDIAFDGVTAFVAEPADSRVQQPASLFVRKCERRFGIRLVGGPRFTVHEDGFAARQFVQLLARTIQGLRVQQAHQIEAESVHMVLTCPIYERIHDEPAEHRPFAGHVVAAARTVGESAGIVTTAEIPGGHALEFVVVLVHVVVNDIHDHTDARPVQRCNHRLALADADGPVIRVGAIRAFRHIVSDRVVPPVVGAAGRLIDRPVVVERHDLHVGDTQTLQIRDAGGESAGLVVQGRMRIGEREELAAMPFGESAVRVVAEIADMRLPNHGLGSGNVGGAVGQPTVGIGRIEIDDHAAFAVDAARLGPRVGGADGDRAFGGVDDGVAGHVADRGCREGQHVVVVGPGEPLGAAILPSPILGTFQRDGRRRAVLWIAGTEQSQCDCNRGRRPHGEDRAVVKQLRPERACVIRPRCFGKRHEFPL